VFFNRGAASAGVQQVDDLLGQAVKLKAQGFEPSDIAKLLPLIGGGVAVSAAPAAAGELVGYL
jgi:hypothetical protein